MLFSAGKQEKKWLIQPKGKCVSQFAESLGVPVLLAQVLSNRQITDVETASVFLNPKLTQLISPGLMPGVMQAVDIIKKAIEKREKITIYGDYDVDGVTGTSILWQILILLGANVEYYIPHRVNEGYGLNAEAVKLIVDSGTKLLITVDCGISANETADLASQLGLDLIITDHHQIGDKLPKALAIVHPALDNSYGNEDSCGAMVAFKLAWTLAEELNGGRMSEKLREFMINAASLAAIGTVADVVPLLGENRIITNFGLKSLSHCGLVGIQALIDSAGLADRKFDSYHIGFRLAPILNAAGRMGHARLAVELLTTESKIHASQIAGYLKEQNTMRRQCEQKIFKQACEQISQSGLSHPDNKSIVIADNNWHTGVIGIVASRIVDKYHRPVIVINTSNGISQGSARSIEGFDILAGIEFCSQHLSGFGGHKMAAGITIDSDKIKKFSVDFEKYAKENLTDDNTIVHLNIDAEVSLSEFDKQTVSELKKLEPFGRSNPEPVFATKGVKLAATPRRVGSKADHIQFAVTDNTNSIKCIGFSMGKLEKKLLENEFFNIAYRPQINTFNGFSNVQLVVEDVQFI